MRRLISYLLGTLLALACAPLQAQAVVVIGSFADANNAAALQATAAQLDFAMSLQDIDAVQAQSNGQQLHRVVLVPWSDDDIRSLLQAARANGFRQAWIAEIQTPNGWSEQPPLLEASASADLQDEQPQGMAKATAQTKPLLPLYRGAAPASAAALRPAESRRKGNTDLTFRLKAFTSSSSVPVTDLNLLQLGNRRGDSALDLRTMLQHDVGRWSFELAHTTLAQHGDGIVLGQNASQSEQIVVSDANRALTLTEQLNAGGRHRSLHRLDRFNLRWRSDRWGVTVGRQAVSWGSGIVFQPLDPFNPFAPTAVDRDYKPGDDLVLVERLFDNGHDAQLLHVLRRDNSGELASANASTAAKWHGYAGLLEFELIAAQHYDADFIGLSGRIPVGPAVLRGDIALRRGVANTTGTQTWGALGVINMDVAFPWRGRTVYAFAEYFHNDFGLAQIPSPLATLPDDLQAGLQRGEFFNLMRDYLAVGGSFEWHPLLNQQLTVITNLHDSSSLLQTQFAYDIGQNQNVQLGWIGSTGGSGDEFAPITVGVLPMGQPVTQGGGDAVYLRWAGYF